MKKSKVQKRWHPGAQAATADLPVIVVEPYVGCDPRSCVGSSLHGLTNRQGMLSFVLTPIPYGLFKKYSRLPRLRGLLDPPGGGGPRKLQCPLPVAKLPKRSRRELRNLEMFSPRPPKSRRLRNLAVWGLTLGSRNHLDQNYKLSPHRLIFDGGEGAQQSEAENVVEQALDG